MSYSSRAVEPRGYPSLKRSSVASSLAILFALVILPVALTLAACSSRGGSPTLPSASAPATAPLVQSATGSAARTLAGKRRRHRPRRRATIRIRIPRGRHHRKFHPGYIPTGTQSGRIHVQTVDGATPAPGVYPDVVANLTTANPNCQSTEGNLTCTIAAPVPVASAVVLQISLYASTDGTGEALAIGTSSAVNTSQPGARFAVTLSGIPNALDVIPSVLSAANDGEPHTMTFTVSATDAHNDLIVPPGNYATPITLTASSSSLTLSPTQITAPPAGGVTTVTVTYHSSDPITQGTITVGGIATPQTIAVNPLVFNPQNADGLFLGGASQTIDVNENGYAGAFTVTGAGSGVSATCNPTNCIPTSTGGTVSITVAPLAHGTGTLAITDANGAKANVPFAVTGQTGPGPITVGGYTVNTIPLGSSMNPGAIAIGPDGQSLWYTLPGINSVGSYAIDTGTETVTGGLPLGSGLLVIPDDLAIGGDGAVYVTARNSADGTGVVVAIDTTGKPGCGTSGGTMVCVMTVLTGPPGTSVPEAVTRGQGPNMWVLDDDASCTCILNYAYLNAGSPPTPAPPTPAPAAPVSTTVSGAAFSSVVEGSDGALWFPDNNAKTIDKGVCTPAGTCTVTAFSGGFSPGSSTPAFSGITSGPDGKIYVLETAANKIAVFQPTQCSGNACTTTEIAIPSANSGALSIATGPGGNVWFTEPNTHRLGILTTSGSNANTIREITLPGATPSGITMGPDGNMWFTETTTGSNDSDLGEVVL